VRSAGYGVHTLILGRLRSTLVSLIILRRLPTYMNFISSLSAAFDHSRLAPRRFLPFRLETERKTHHGIVLPSTSAVPSLARFASAGRFRPLHATRHMVKGDTYVLWRAPAVSAKRRLPPFACVCRRPAFAMPRAHAPLRIGGCQGACGHRLGQPRFRRKRTLLDYTRLGAQTVRDSGPPVFEFESRRRRRAVAFVGFGRR